jgi:hypothetical protein
MPIIATAMPAHPECDGDQWTIDDVDEIAELAAHILVGRAFHAALILQGVRLEEGPITADIKAKLNTELHPNNEARTHHRDGVLFEIICWIAAKITASPNEALTYPHLKATNQGADCIKVLVDPQTAFLQTATVYEYKCTTNWRGLFRDDVMKTFRQYASGERDNQLSQEAIALFEKMGLQGLQLKAAYDRLIQQRPLAYRASLTVEPGAFTADQRLALFAGFDGVGATVADRLGDTLPLEDIRRWFSDFSDRVWERIQAFDV